MLQLYCCKSIHLTKWLFHGLTGRNRIPAPVFPTSLTNLLKTITDTKCSGMTLIMNRAP